MKKITALLVIFTLWHSYMFAQAGNNGTHKASVIMEGQVAVTTNGEGIYLNFGGPCMKYSFKKIGFSIGMMPSLRFQQDKPKTYVIPILGGGLQVYMLNNRRCILSFPCYYNSAKNRWTVTGGFGYLLTRPKK